MKVVVAQKGAREHFLAARALHRQDHLAQLVVDWYAFGQRGKRKAEGGKGRLFQYFRNRGRSALAARCEAIPDGLVRAFPWRSLWWKGQERAAARRGSTYATFLKTDANFARAAARCQLPPHDVFFGYSYASLEMLRAEKAREIFTIVDQIDPGPMEFRMVAEERSRFPELAGPPDDFPTAYYDRARQEWEIADLIVVNSEWSRAALVMEGVNPAKIEILPLAYEMESGAEELPSTFNPRPARNTPLRVLWLGQVNVRKGIHYLIEAAGLLKNEPVQFQVAGPIGIRPEIMKASPSNIRWRGPVPRSEATACYAEADVFVLPTLSDGFAITQLEAFAHGVPVIATPHCARVVTDNKTGFIVPARDAAALAAAILRFARNPGLAQAMASACRAAAGKYSIDAYGRQLTQMMDQHISRRQSGNNLASTL